MILEYGLREAVSFSKGCYVGQEVVERSDAVGKIPRFLERLEIDLAQPALVGSDLVINQQQLKGASISNVSGEVLGRVVGVIADRISYQDKRGGSELISSFKLFALLRNGRYKVEDELFCGEGLKCRIVR
jgi:folate-binding Fe-S cluster repair protein YgfZ